MKKLIFYTLFLVLALTIVNSAQAQFNYKKKATPATKDTIAVKPVEVAPVVVSTVAIDTNIKSTKTVDTTMVGGFNANNRKSLRPNYGFFTENNVRKATQQRTPMAYENLREEDALFSEFVWEEIDGREKINRPFIYQAYDDNGDQRFFALLLSNTEFLLQVLFVKRWFVWLSSLSNQNRSTVVVFVILKVFSYHFVNNHVLI